MSDDRARMMTENLQAFEARKEELLSAAEGKFAVVHAGQVAGTWESYEDALAAAYEKFGLEPFLVKQIQGSSRAQFITRLLVPCRA